MWQFVQGYKIPESLGGQPSPIPGGPIPRSAYLCHQIPVISNRARAAAFARGRIVEPVPGLGILNSIGAFQSVVGSETSIAQLMASTFDINRDLVEMFPSLEYTGDSASLDNEEISKAEGVDMTREPLGFQPKDSTSDPIEYEENRRVYEAGVKPKSFFDRMPFPYAAPEDVFSDPDKGNMIRLLLEEEERSGVNVGDTGFAARLAEQLVVAGVTDYNEVATKGPTNTVREKLSWIEELGANFVSPLARNLQANPVIIYRMAPLRSLGINKIVQDARKDLSFNTKILGHDQITWYTEATKGEMSPDLKYRGKFRDPHFFVQADEVRSIEAIRDDTHRHNAFTIDPAMMGNSTLRFWSDAGLPFFDLESVQRYGAKIMTVEWPLLPRKEKNEHEDAVLAYMRTICAQAFHILGRRRDQMSGTIQMAYRPDIMHGEAISVELDKSHSVAFGGVFAEHSRTVTPPHLGYPSSNTASRPKNDKFKAPKSLGDAVKAKAEEIADTISGEMKNAPKQVDGAALDPAEGPRLSAYVEGVRHFVNVSELGGIQFRTSVDYNFGVFDPTTRLVRIVDIEN
jgi:hypothetical protein